MGFGYGVFNASCVFFFPAIRRFALYKRVPVACLFLAYWMNWGYHYGRDLVLVKTRNLIENWERDHGIRNFQLGL